MLNKTKKQRKGISLIVLVITIIVIIILAATIIMSLSGDNNIINNAKKAVKDSNTSQLKEEIELEVVNLALLNNNRIGIYSWDLSAINYDDLTTMKNTLKINSIYQGMRASDIKVGNEDFDDLVEYCKLNGLNLYILSGETSWYNDTTAIYAKKYINSITEYNDTNNSNFKIKGFISDIEYYTTTDWNNATTSAAKDTIINTFITSMNTYYSLFKNNGLEFSICMSPYVDPHLNNSQTHLEKIVKSCDSLEVMNYYKDGSVERLKPYIDAAKKYGKSLTTVSEFMEPDGSDIPEQITYYNEGVLPCIKNFNQIRKMYSYNGLGYSYHHYTPLSDVFANMNFTNPKYTYQLTTTNGAGESVEFAEAYYKSSDGTSIKAVQRGNVYTFYGLEYDKEYKLYVDSPKFDYSNSKIKFNKKDGKYITGDLKVEVLTTYSLIVYCNVGNYAKIVDTVKIKNGDYVATGNARPQEGGSYNIYAFYNVVHNKEYTLEIEDDKYELESEATVINTDTSNTEFYKTVYIKEK